MTLTDLTDDELITFISLARIVIRADLEFSEDEEYTLEAIGEQVGAARWKSIVAHAMTEVTSRDAAMAAAAAVSTPEARRAIHEGLTKLATSDEMVPAEQAVLDELTKLWRQTN